MGPLESWEGAHSARIGIGPGSLLLCARPAGWWLKNALILARAWTHVLFLIMGSMVLEHYSASEVIEDLDTGEVCMAAVCAALPFVTVTTP